MFVYYNHLVPVMNIKEIRDYLGRVKLYYQRNDTVRALGAAVAALKGLGAGQAPLDVRTLLRDATQLLGRDQKIRVHLKGPLAYQPGEEAVLLRQLMQAYSVLHAEGAKEDRETALARKIRLDQALNQGMRELEMGRASEADACFAEAVNNYKDEHHMLYLIGKALMEAGEVRRALPYLKRGATAAPNREDMKALFEECQSLREELKSR